ncbi:MAG TPA: FtsQ-type POTRA domain-containing protein [Acidimicrobiales bacterium]|nr:FtsQ-type POTRA domain-containing protein [Acidimicrobiales bacterium]
MSRRRPVSASRPRRSPRESRRARSGPATTRASRVDAASAREKRARPTAPTRPRSAPADIRAHPRRRLILVLLAVVSAAAIVFSGVEWTLRSPLFRVRHVSFVGLRHESASAVLAASGLAADPPIIDVSASAIDARLHQFPWVQSVAVIKHWPNRVVVRVTERTAVAVAYAPGHVLVYVDATGHDLGSAPRTANLPTLVYANPRAATWPFLLAGRAAAYVASQLPPAFSSQVSSISVNAAGDVTLAMTTPVRFVLGPATNLHAKWVSIASVIAHARLVPGDVVDVSVPGSLAVTGGAPS